jgi:Stress responsive A/B Barrel Domain
MTTPQFNHLVLFNSATATPEDDVQFATLIAEFGDIPGVLSTTGGRIATPGAPFTHALVVEFIDEAAYRAYRPHPVHRRFAEWFAPKSQVVLLDFIAVRHVAEGTNQENS